LIARGWPIRWRNIPIKLIAGVLEKKKDRATLAANWRTTEIYG
jgi:hypothetical protein